MFTDIEKKLKGVAIVNLIFGIVIALACLVIMEEDGILIASAAVLTSLISSWFIYAFAELLENTKRISHILQIVFDEDISKDLERQKQIEKAKEEEKARQKQLEKAREGEKVRSGQYAPYWAKGPEDLNGKKGGQEKDTE